MFDGLFKPKFYTKCKSLIKLTKTRLENVRRKKNAVCKYLKNDIADLLKNGLDYNAYGRTEGLLDERKRICCYDFVERFYGSLGSNVSLMQKSRECPEECREAVSSLIYAAARIPEIPELLHLRSLFTDKYGNSLEAFVDQEFVESFKVKPPSKETKVQLMKEIAQEFSITWDSKELEQKLFTPTPKAQPERTKKEASKIKIDPENKHRRRASMEEKSKFVCSSSEDESNKTMDSFERDSVQASWSSFGSISEDEPETRKPNHNNRFVPTANTKPISQKDEANAEPNLSTVKLGKEEKSSDLDVGSPVGSKPTPRSVRRRFAKPMPGNSAVRNVSSEGNLQEKATNDEKGDEKSIYPLKPPPYRQALSRRHLKCDSMGKWELKNDVVSGRSSKTHVRSGSWQPEPSSGRDQASRDGFKLPDYDELAEMLAELRKK